MSTVVDDAYQPSVVTREIVVTPENPDGEPEGPTYFDVEVPVMEMFLETLSPDLELSSSTFAVDVPTMEMFVETLLPDVTLFPNLVLTPPSMDMYLEMNAPSFSLFSTLVLDVPMFTSMESLSFAPMLVFPGIAHIDVPRFTDVESQFFAPELVFLSVLHIDVPRFPSIESQFFTPSILSSEVLSFTPDDGAQLPISSNVGFTFVLTSDDPSTLIEVQVDTNSFYPSPLTGSSTATDVSGTTSNTVIVPGELFTGGLYYWRYRLTVGGFVGQWSPSYVFVVAINLEASSSSYDGSWTVVSGTAAPIIWFLYPASGVTGDKVTIYGQGLNVSTAYVSVGSFSNATIVSKTSVDVDPDIPPIIDETTSVVSIAHDEIVFLIPDVASPGGEVTVSV